MGIKRPGSEADHSPSSSAEVKNGAAINPLSHKSSWRGAYLIKHRDSFTFFITQLLNIRGFLLHYFNNSKLGITIF
jgi:hypothetical protein